MRSDDEIPLEFVDFDSIADVFVLCDTEVIEIWVFQVYLYKCIKDKILTLDDLVISVLEVNIKELLLLNELITS